MGLQWTTTMIAVAAVLLVSGQTLSEARPLSGAAVELFAGITGRSLQQANTNVNVNVPGVTVNTGSQPVPPPPPGAVAPAPNAIRVLVPGIVDVNVDLPPLPKVQVTSAGR